MKLKRLLFLLTCCILCISHAFAQISPGELSKAHASLEGISNCTKCHDVGNKVTRQKCLECHKEIKANIIARKGYHGSTEVRNKDCAGCHSEHHGRDFQLIRFNKKTFDHSKTGFALKGEHAKQECNACHKPAFIKDPAIRKKAGTYLGLSQQCLSCHDDFHQGKMSSRCTDCHGFNSFKNAKPFDHSKTRYPLLGKHKDVACKECHKPEIVNGKTREGFKNLAFANCNSCHKDPHENKFGQNCKQCHTEESFHIIKGIKTFDHDKTGFKLIGKHQTVECKACHKTGNMTDPIKHDRCSDCHADYHKKEFAVNGVSPDCNKCHTNNGFTPSTFTIEKHNMTKFKLEGAHMATACTACHKKQKDWTFRNMGSRCVDCHTNVHKGFIPDRFFPNEDCTACHNVKNWKEVTFDHNKTGFKLEGEHAKIACAECHYRKNANGVRVQQFKRLSRECSSCHKDSHAGQFAVNGKTDCTRCHGFDKWENSKFDHNTSRFKLDGAHATVKCEACHKQVTNEKGTYIEYKFDNITCARCHS